MYDRHKTGVRETDVTPSPSTLVECTVSQARRQAVRDKVNYLVAAALVQKRIGVPSEPFPGQPSLGSWGGCPGCNAGATTCRTLRTPLPTSRVTALSHDYMCEMFTLYLLLDSRITQCRPRKASGPVRSTGALQTTTWKPRSGRPRRRTA